MSSAPGSRREPDRDSADAVSAVFLVSSVAQGDEAALRQLMIRYDRLVRYTIFRLSRNRAHADPQWLDGVASATWAGFVGAVRRDPANPPTGVSSLLMTIARNQTISSLRAARAPESANLSAEIDGDGPYPDDERSDPAERAAHLEFLEQLRDCLGRLGDDDRTLAGELSAILDRRWQEAAAALGMAESTLRSRWERVLERLRACLRRKSGESFAPRHGRGDN